MLIDRIAANLLVVALLMTVLASAACSEPAPALDVDATIAAGVQATIDANALAKAASTSTPVPIPPTPRPADTPLPAPTPKPAPTNTPEPTATHTPLPTATHTLTPTSAPTFTPTPTNTSTAIPTSTPTPTPMSVCSYVQNVLIGAGKKTEPCLTHTPTGTWIASPTHTRVPNIAPTPPPTFQPTKTPMPTRVAIATLAPTRIPSASNAVAPTPTLADVVRNIQPGLVHIIASSGTGSGFVIDEEGLIVTNEHVVVNSRTLTVRFVDGREYNGTVLGKDSIADLAVVRLNGNGRFEPMALGDSNSISIGDDVMALGFPLSDRLGNSPTITRGILSSRRTFRGIERLQTDAAINPGNSGGPLVNRIGEVIGISTSKIDETSSGRPVDNIGFAVSVNELKDRMGSLAGHGSSAAKVNSPTPVSASRAHPTPTVIPRMRTTHRSGRYGYSIDIDAGWTLDEEEATERYSSFWAADRKAIFSIRSHELGENYSLKELAEWRRNRLGEMAKEEAWNVFDITYFQKQQENGREFYRLVYRSQTSDEYCVSSRIEIIFLSAWYPEKPYGFSLIGNVCEHSISKYAQARDMMLGSFKEWDIHRNANYEYSIDITPGWELDEEKTTDNYAVFWAKDKKAILSIHAYDLGTNYSLNELAKLRRDDLEETAREERWNVFEMTSFQKRREDGREFYWMTYRYQSSDEFCISDRSELVALSSRYPVKPYGYSVAGGVCEDNLNDLGEERDGMLVNFRY